MDYIAKQAIKSKAGALTGTIDNLSKDVSDKCKKAVTKEEEVVDVSAEELLAAKEADRKAHYAEFNAGREEQRNNLRNKYGLKKAAEPAGTAAAEPAPPPPAEPEKEEESKCSLM